MSIFQSTVFGKAFVCSHGGQTLLGFAYFSNKVAPGVEFHVRCSEMVLDLGVMSSEPECELQSAICPRSNLVLGPQDLGHKSPSKNGPVSCHHRLTQESSHTRQVARWVFQMRETPQEIRRVRSLARCLLRPLYLVCSDCKMFRKLKYVLKEWEKLRGNVL